MKAKHALFYVTAVPLCLIVLVMDCVIWTAMAVVSVVRATYEVCHVILGRYEHWAFDCPRDYFVNTPFKHTLRVYWIKEYQRAMNGEGEWTK